LGVYTGTLRIGLTAKLLRQIMALLYSLLRGVREAIRFLSFLLVCSSSSIDEVEKYAKMAISVKTQKLFIWHSTVMYIIYRVIFIVDHPIFAVRLTERGQ
jgi:hypothetical protein